MTISDFAIKRPVASIVMSLIIVLFGVVGFSFLGIRLYPAIDPPVITVQTTYTGANANIIESQITEPLEKAINGIEGVRTISSSTFYVINRNIFKSFYKALFSNNLKIH